MEHNTNDAKLILKFEFLSNNKIKVTLVSVKDNILYNASKNIGYNYCSNDNHIFNVWSSGTFLFDSTQMRLPSSALLKPNIFSVWEFPNDYYAKSTLKNLYSTLTIWANKIDNENYKNRVIVENEYWYVK